VAVDNSGGELACSIARSDRSMLPMEFLGGPSEFQEYYQHEGEEFIYVVSGAIEVDLKGSALQTLRSRDSLYYDASIPYRWRVVGDEPVWVLAVPNRAH
jgi:uncharacterized cupin superfamily protein